MIGGTKHPEPKVGEIVPADVDSTLVKVQKPNLPFGINSNVGWPWVSMNNGNGLFVKRCKDRQNFLGIQFPIQ